MRPNGTILVCFAVPDEAKFFRKKAAQFPDVRILVCGMGRKNATAAVNHAMTRDLPALIITCGYAGGLHPDLKRGQLVSDLSITTLQTELRELGTVPCRILCAERIAITAAEKQKLRAQTGADVVEMESEAIHETARQHGVPCATLRVISDTAGEDLPLDFNALQTADAKMNYLKLAGALIRSPTRIPRLMAFAQKLKPSGIALAGGLETLLQRLQTKS